MKARFESKVFVYDPALVDTSQIDLDLILDKPKINNAVDEVTAVDEIKLPIKNSIFTARKFTKNGNTMEGYVQQPAEFIDHNDSEEYVSQIEDFLESFTSSESDEERARQAKKQRQRPPKSSYKKWSKSDHCKYCRSIRGLPLTCDRVCLIYRKRD